ncbi:MAG: MFS transporter [Saprospiraceae bacterium]|nr:MFS transporter [Saprospiraceae bacterium]
MNKWLQHKVLNLKPEESGRVVYLFTFAFFVGLFVSFYFALANSLFIEAFGVAKLPQAYIASGFLGLIMMRGFTTLQSKLNIQRVFPIVFIVVIIVMISGRFTGTICEECFIQKANAAALFVLAAPLLTLTAICTSGLAFNLFDIRQSKRLFGLSVSGETFASIIGYFMIPILAKILPYDYDLLFFATFGAVGALIMLLLIFKKFSEQFHTPKKPKAFKETPKTKLFGNRYYVLIFSSVILSYIAIYFVDFGFLGGVSLISPDDSTQIVGLIASFFMITKSAEFLLSLLSGRIIVAQGLKFSLVLLPISIFAATAIIIGVINFGMESQGAYDESLFYILFFFLAMSKFLDRVIRKAIDRPASRALYQTIPKSDRVQLQSKIEGSAQLIGTFAAGGILLLHGLLFPVEVGNNHQEVIHINSFSTLFIPVLIAWSVIMFLIYNLYRNRLTDFMQLDTGDSSGTSSNDQTNGNKRLVNGFRKTDLLHALHYPEMNVLTSPNKTSEEFDPAANILTVLDNEKSLIKRNRILIQAARQQHPSLKPYLVELLTHPGHATIARKVIPDFGNAIYEDLNAQFFKTNDQRVRLKIIELFADINTDKTHHGLFQLISYPTPEIQTKAIEALHEIDHKASPVQKATVENKIQEYTAHITWIYNCLYELKDFPEMEKLIGYLSLHQEGLKKSILYLLGMLYGADKANLIEKNLKNENNLEGSILALELLDNYVDNHLKDLVMPLFEDISLRKKLSLLEKQIPQQHFRSTDRLRNRLEDIIIRNYIKTGIVSKAEALRLINHLFPGDNDALNMASIYHHHPYIVEEAAKALNKSDVEQFQSRIQLLSSSKKTELTALFSKKDFHLHTLETKINKLKSMPLFKYRNMESLMPLALSMEYVTYSLGSQIHLTNEIIDDYYWYVDSGQLDGYVGDQQHLNISAGEFVLEKVYPKTDVLFLEALEVTGCYKIKKDLVLDFLMDGVGLN